MEDWKIERRITEQDFKHTFGRHPKHRHEFEAFCYVVEKSLNYNTDWNTLFEDAKEAIK